MGARNLILLLFAVFGFSEITAQKNPVLYAGFDYFRHTGFTNNSFGNLNIGTQLYHWKIFAPEIGFDHYWGSLEDQYVYKDNSSGFKTPIGVLDRKFSTAVFTLNPKIKLGREDAYITFSPMYHFGNVNARGNYFERNDNSRLVVEERQRTSSPISFWSFSIGVEGLAIQTEKYWFSLSLNYTEVSANDALSLLDFSERDIHLSGISTTTIGFGLRFYYNPFPVRND